MRSSASSVIARRSLRAYRLVEPEARQGRSNLRTEIASSSRPAGGTPRNDGLGEVLLCALSVFLLVCCISASAQEASSLFDHSDWDTFLKKAVSDEGKVDYAAVNEARSHLERYLERLKTVNGKEFSTWPREERVALLINAFNAGVIHSVLELRPSKSVIGISGFWDRPAVQIGESYVSLNRIQNETLRQQYRDERVLFALSTGAKSSPPLRREAYTARRLNGQLYLAARDFVNDETKNQIDATKKKVELSRLFKWYGSDFLLNWGNFPEEERWKPEEMAVLSFVAHYLKDPTKIEFLRQGEYKVKYHDFDWNFADP